MSERPEERVGRRGRATFRERDLKAAIRAAEAVGKNVARARITQAGEIEVIFGSGEIQTEKTNPWDNED
jgi:hypothetical protein